MDQIKRYALDMAMSGGANAVRSVEDIVARAEAFERFLLSGAAATSKSDEGMAASAATDSAESRFGIIGSPSGIQADEFQRSQAEVQALVRANIARKQAELTDARSRLIESACSGSYGVLGLKEFMLAGMPEWMARAAAEAMRQDIESTDSLNAENRKRDWWGLARRFLHQEQKLRAPDPSRRKFTFA